MFNFSEANILLSLANIKFTDLDAKSASREYKTMVNISPGGGLRLDSR